MDSIIETKFNQLIQQLSIWIFEQAEGMLEGIEQFLGNPSIFKLSHLFLILSMGILLFFGLKRSIHFLSDREFQMQAYLKENKRNIIRMGLILLICLFPNQILDFTFHYWNSLIDEGAVFKQLQASSEHIQGETISISMVMILSSLSALYIALLQFIEVIGLVAILFMSPMILIAFLFKRSSFDRFFKVLTRAVINPINQTLLMYMSFQYFIPLFMSEGNDSPFMQILLMIGMLFFCLQGAKVFSGMMVAEQTKITA